MKIGIVTPAPPGSHYGNRITAIRWSKILRKLGHRVSISQKYKNEHHDLLIALHARRSYSSIVRFRREHPGAPIILALTGTDVYGDIRVSERARQSLKLADRIVVLQPRSLRELNRASKNKAHVIYQSVEEIYAPSKSTRPFSQRFDVCVVGHLRPVKDPFRAALAARLLPGSSKIRILQIGGAMTKRMKIRARQEAQINVRYHWLGELSRARTLRILSTSDLCVVSSRIEGGANVLSEAIVAAIPVLASRIDGNIGILGRDYPGLFSEGDKHQLARLLARAEIDPKFLLDLKRRVCKLAALFHPAKEEEAWERLLNSIRVDPLRPLSKRANNVLTHGRLVRRRGVGHQWKRNLISS